MGVVWNRFDFELLVQLLQTENALAVRTANAPSTLSALCLATQMTRPDQSVIVSILGFLVPERRIDSIHLGVSIL